MSRESVLHEKTEQPTPTCPMLTTCVPPVAGDSVPELDFTATSAHTREVQQHTTDTVSSSSTMDSYYLFILTYLMCVSTCLMCVCVCVCACLMCVCVCLTDVCV